MPQDKLRVKALFSYACRWLKWLTADSGEVAHKKIQYESDSINPRFSKEFNSILRFFKCVSHIVYLKYFLFIKRNNQNVTIKKRKKNTL